jgi:nucleosome binding factor SPN SPT16 subunit
LICHDAQQLLINSLKVGSTLASAYTATKNFISSKNPSLGIHTNFGFGIGFNFKEELLLI